MNQIASPPDLHGWIAGLLDPLDEDSPVDGASDRVGASDFDLGPGGPPSLEPLVPAAVLIALMPRDHGHTVLLTRRSDTLRRHTGQVALPGGRRDPGETAAQTALREAHEEVGLAPRHVRLAGLSTPYRTGTGYLIVPVVGFVTPGFTLQANPDEVADIFETPFGFLMDPANHEEHERETPDGQRRRYYAMTHEDRVIWGATAGILRALYHRLYGAAVA